MSKFNIRKTALFYNYYYRLKNIALSVFEWENLPETCNARFLEDCLFNYGHAIFVEDEIMSFLNLKVTPSDTLNVYEEPTGFTAFSVDYSKYYSADNCVYIRNNYLARATDLTTMIFAEKLTRYEMTKDINVQAQKTPVLIECDDKTKKSLEVIYNQYSGDKPVIYANKTLNEKPLNAISTGAPFVADKIREEKIAVWNEYLEFLGINTNPSDKKKERLIVSEVNSNNEQIDIQGATMLLCRQKACEEINKKYNLNVSVKKRIETVDDFKPSLVSGGVE